MALLHISDSFEKIKEHLISAPPFGFSIIKIDEYQYKFLADISWGTLLIKGAPSMVEGIKIFGTFKRIGEGTTEVILESRLRIELIIIVIIWLIAISKLLPGSQNIPWWINTILFPVTLVWFWFVYRFQENKLKLKVEEYLRAAK